MTLNRLKPMLTAVAVLVLTAVVPAQQDERARALEQQIDRIYKANEYALPRFGPARWLADGTAYTTVERSTGPRAPTSFATTPPPARAAC